MLNLFWFTALWFKVEDLYRWSVWDLNSSFMSTFLIDDYHFLLWPPGLYLKRDYKKSWLMAAIWFMYYVAVICIKQRVQILLSFYKEWNAISCSTWMRFWEAKFIYLPLAMDLGESTAHICIWYFCDLKAG